jgi:hypothetical protein
MALIVGAKTFDRLFGGVRFDEVDGDILFVLQRVRRCVPPSDLRNGYACRLLGLAKRLGRSCYASELIRQQLLP